MKTSRAPGSAPSAELPSEKAFVLQLARESDPGTGRFEGRLEHLSSGRRVRFEALDDFVAALTRLLEESKHR